MTKLKRQITNMQQLTIIPIIRGKEGDFGLIRMTKAIHWMETMLSIRNIKVTYCDSILDLLESADLSKVHLHPKRLISV